MPRPSQLSIDTSSVLRLLKEEKSYRIELKQQEARLEVLEGRGKEDGIGDPNYDFQVKQEVGLPHEPTVHIQNI